MGVYFRGDGHADSPDFKHLLGDVLAYKVAGLIIVGSPRAYLKTPVTDRAQLASIIIGSPDGDLPVARLQPAFVDRALDLLAKRDRHRTAWLGNATELTKREFVSGWMATIGRQRT